MTQHPLEWKTTDAVSHAESAHVENAASGRPRGASFAELQEVALRVREHVIRMAGGGGCFLGASLSAADILVSLYFDVARVAPAQRDSVDRDYVFLSKGHDVPALYGVLAEAGFFDRSRLTQHLSMEDVLYWHPNTGVPGVEFHSGSLGHLLSVAMGVALDIQRCGRQNRVFVVLGDGELNEGSVWEAALVANALRLSNLIAIVDRNRYQANMATEELVPLEPLAAKFEAFGWNTRTISGHDFGDLRDALDSPAPGPRIVLAETQRNRGLPSLEGKIDRWFCRFSDEEVLALLGELHGAKAPQLHSLPLTVR